jgi:acylphosphatase
MSAPDNPQQEEIHLFVAGRVQGVGFRRAASLKARQIGVRGWVRNTPDGRVEIQAAGSADQIDRLVAWCRQGPPAAQVTGLEIASRLPGPATSLPAGFDVRP